MPDLVLLTATTSILRSIVSAGHMIAVLQINLSIAVIVCHMVMQVNAGFFEVFQELLPEIWPFSIGLGIVGLRTFGTLGGVWFQGAVGATFVPIVLCLWLEEA